MEGSSTHHSALGEGNRYNSAWVNRQSQKLNICENIYNLKLRALTIREETGIDYFSWFTWNGAGVGSGQGGSCVGAGDGEERGNLREKK